ncbi:MAG: hypothetical protein ACJ8NR_02965 [Sulfurifustis sp.]
MRQDIQRSLRAGHIVKVWRERIDQHPVIGYIVQASDELVLVHMMDDGIRLDGYSVMRFKDITEIEQNPQYRGFYERALQLRKQSPNIPRALLLHDLSVSLRSINENYPIMSIERETLAPGKCGVGKLHMVTESTVILKVMTPGARWEGYSRRYRLADITRIEFDTSYLRALALVTSSRGRRG